MHRFEKWLVLTLSLLICTIIILSFDCLIGGVVYLVAYLFGSDSPLSCFVWTVLTVLAIQLLFIIAPSIYKYFKKGS